MNFITDKQTIEDLNLLGKHRSNSIYSLFNQVSTMRAERLLQQMFQHPLKDLQEINKRSSIFKHFAELGLVFPVDNEMFSAAESYLDGAARMHVSLTIANLLSKKLQHSFLRDEQYEIFLKGLQATIDLLHIFHDFLNVINAAGKPENAYKKELQNILDIFANPQLQWLTRGDQVIDLPVAKLAKYDHLLKHTLREEMKLVLEAICRLDIYIAVAKVSRERNYSFAKALPASESDFKASALWHPALIKGVANPLTFDRDQNMIFLTGANMAGKSTFMKSIGIAIYLAHMGFPVAAKDMEFGIRDGLYTSINVPDNLSMGYSHFYAEVLRVKTVAAEVSSGKKLVVLFDELFKGTNVKDAFDATFAVTEAFSEYRTCLFVISTHIIEVGEVLGANSANVQFAYLPTVMNGNVPEYTYRLEAGITSDRQGMIIIENEGILS